jgi:hypothetical protein
LIIYPIILQAMVVRNAPIEATGAPGGDEKGKDVTTTRGYIVKETDGYGAEAPVKLSIDRPF